MHQTPLLLTFSILLPTLAFAPAPTNPPEWVHTLAEAQTKAKAADKPILIYCWADGSDYCTNLFQDTLSAEGAGEALSEFVCYSARHGKPGVEEVFKRYGVATLPTMLFVSPDGHADDLIQGFIPVEDFVMELARILKGEGTVRGLEDQLKSATRGSDDDVSARWALAGKIQALGNQQRHDELMESIREVDPKGNTLIGARLRLNDLVDEIVKRAKSDGKQQDGEGKKKDSEEGESEEQFKKRAAEWDLTPLYVHAKSVKLNEAKHEAWQRIGSMEVNRVNMQGAFKAFKNAHRTCPEEKVVDWSNNIARWIIKSAEQRTSKEKKFALELANSAMTTMKKRLAAEPPSEDQQDKYAGYQAYCWNTIAWCHHISGKRAAAVKAQKMCLELRETDDYKKDLAKMSK